MDSGIKELEQVLYNLNNYMADRVSDNGAQMAGIEANDISELLREVNNTLSGGWESVGDFFEEISEAVANCINNVQQLMTNYVESSQKNKEQELSMIKNHEESTQSILNDMGIE